MDEENKSQQHQACEGQCKEETPKEETTEEALGGQRNEDVLEGQREQEVSEERKEEAPKGQQKEAAPRRQRKWTRVDEYVYQQLKILAKDLPSDPDAITEEQNEALRVGADRLKDELLALRARCKKAGKS